MHSESIPATNNPLSDFLRDRISYFADESRRLRDKGVLLEYRTLYESMFSIRKKLGTVEHEVALDALQQEYNKAGPEAAQAWAEIWRDFRDQRARARDFERDASNLDREAQRHIRAIEDSVKDAEEDDAEWAQSLRDVLATMKQADTSAKEFSRGLWIGPWLILLANLQVYTVYVRYFMARLSFLLLRHGFIVVVLVLLFGIVYSKVAAGITAAVTALAPTESSIVAGSVVALYLLKRYYFDAKLKKLQVHLESRWLARVALHVHIVRTLALVSRTLARPTPSVA